ncbi:MAG: hypothetical protein AMS18_16800 [Gemmatimonas sp. SG8_17]|nr:MAG: hypothetical protein AMS18_16800 [Gemmatimonas sp. SG8_17]
MKSLLEIVTTAVVLGGLAGCAAAPPPTVQMGPNAEVTADGLHRVDNSVMAMAWVKPDLDLTGYTKLMVDEITVAYQKEPRATQHAPGASEDNFALTRREMDNLKRWFNEAVVTALTKDDGWEIVDAPGPDVLRVSVYLIDLVVRTPAQDLSFQRTFTRSYGEVTLVIELQDSESEEFLARAAERRDPTRATDNGLARVSPSAVKVDVQSLFDYWANTLRQGLDRLREVDLP